MDMLSKINLLDAINNIDLQRFLSNSDLNTTGLISGIKKLKSSDQNLIMDCSDSDYNINILGIVHSYSNQPSHLILITVCRYHDGNPNVLVKNLSGSENHKQYGVYIYYKIEDGRTRVWLKGFGLLLGNNTTINARSEAIPSDAILLNF